MRILACLLLLCIAGPALAGQKLAHDFGGARFDPDSFRYGGPTPDKFLTLEGDGLRLRYTGAGAPPTNNPSGVACRFHVRGNFLATVRYEILQCEPPSRGTFLAGAELYLQLDNPTSDAATVARGVYLGGSAAIYFKVLTRDAAGKRISWCLPSPASRSVCIAKRVQSARPASQRGRKAPVKRTWEIFGPNPALQQAGRANEGRSWFVVRPA